MLQDWRRQNLKSCFSDDVGGDDDVGRDGRLGAAQRGDEVGERAELGLDHLARVDGNILLAKIRSFLVNEFNIKEKKLKFLQVD